MHAEPYALFTQLYGYRPSKLAPATYARKELACIDLVLEAIGTFADGRLAEFDARVGDTNCQVLTHQIIDLALQRPLARHARLERDLERARHILGGWHSSRSVELRSLALAARVEGAVVDLSLDDVLLANSHVMKKITRDDDSRSEQLLKDIGGETANEWARQSINRITDAHIDTMVNGAASDWRARGEDELAEDISTLQITLRTRRKMEDISPLGRALSTRRKPKRFYVRIPYSDSIALMARMWQQRIPVGIRLYVLMSDHQHLETLLYLAHQDRCLRFDPVPADLWSNMAREPAMIGVGLSDPMGIYPGLPVDSFYRMRATRTTLRGDGCCGSIRSKLMADVGSIDLSDLFCAEETLRSYSSSACDRITSDVTSQGRARYVAGFERRRKLALEGGISVHDASLLRLVHIAPGAVQDIL